MVWVNANPEKRAEVVRAIGRSYPAFKRDPERCNVATLDLPFYPGGQLVKLSARDIPGSLLWYVCLPSESVALGDGMIAINHCNALAPLVVNDATVFAYVKFKYYFSTGARLFEAKVKRSAVGHTGKIWIFEKNDFYDIDVNISPRGLVTELEKTKMDDVPDFVPGDFDL